MAALDLIGHRMLGFLRECSSGLRSIGAIIKSVHGCRGKPVHVDWDREHSLVYMEASK